MGTGFRNFKEFPDLLSGGSGWRVIGKVADRTQIYGQDTECPITIKNINCQIKSRNPMRMY
jgi:hypothetical protein